MTRLINRFVVLGEKAAPQRNVAQKKTTSRKVPPSRAAIEDRNEQRRFEQQIKDRHRAQRLQKWLAQGDRVSKCHVRGLGHNSAFLPSHTGGNVRRTHGRTHKSSGSRMPSPKLHVNRTIQSCSFERGHFFGAVSFAVARVLTCGDDWRLRGKRANSKIYSCSFITRI